MVCIQAKFQQFSQSNNHLGDKLNLHASISGLNQKIFFPVSQMIWMQNLIEMKNNAIVMVLEVLDMPQTFSLELNSLLKYFFQTGLILNTVPILVPEQRTKISMVLKLIRLRYIPEFRSNFNENRPKMAIKPHKMHLLF